MATNFERASEFMRAFGQNVNSRATLQNEETANLRYELIREELQELQDAMDSQNLLEIADALTDILYVTYGAGHAYGIDLDACYHEVHRSNMTKLGADGKPVHREDGKVMKGPDYDPPHLAKIILS